MALSQHLVQKQTQRLIITQDLRQSIELLPLSNLELQDRIQKELLENPLLEEAPESEAAPSSETDQAPEAIEQAANAVETRHEFEGEDNWQSHSREFAEDRAAAAERSERKNQFLQNSVRSGESLSDHLLWQLRLSEINEAQMRAGEVLISAIDDRGFLVEPPEELLTGSGISAADAEAALQAIYQLDPIGCGARNIQESLYVQARLLKPEEGDALLLLESHFEELEKLDYKRIERISGLDRERIEAALSFIRTLEPYPGTLYAQRPPEYIIPDVVIAEIDGAIEVIVNDDWLPGLRVNEEYKSMLRGGGNAADREYLQARLASAQWLIKSVRQRRATLYRVTRSITEFQDEFFRHGPSALKPLTLRMVAEKVELHESTVSRITTNKYAQTRWGVFELKYFFSSSLRSSTGDAAHSSRSIQDRIKQLVDQEDIAEPLSDQQIVELVRREGVEIARRTVAKYRKLLRIPAADRRKKVNQLNARPESARGDRNN
ncbi:MAG: RNA polymerase factor sigma-54 [Leptospirales bacterium]|nr:RNA polymerase factor sigma-54 [Leptospirales bacterium]